MIKEKEDIKKFLDEIGPKYKVTMNSETNETTIETNGEVEKLNNQITELGTELKNALDSRSELIYERNKLEIENKELQTTMKEMEKRIVSSDAIKKQNRKLLKVVNQFQSISSLLDNEIKKSENKNV